MPSKNKLNKIVSNINALPEFLRSKALSTFFGKMVKFTGTAGIIIEELNEQKAVISLKNKKAVQNHIGSVHAVASILIAESASGYVVGMNIPDTSVPVIKTIKADYTGTRLSTSSKEHVKVSLESEEYQAVLS